MTSTGFPSGQSGSPRRRTEASIVIGVLGLILMAFTFLATIAPREVRCFFPFPDCVGPNSDPRTTRTIEVAANLPISSVDGGVNSGINVKRGQQVHIKASGRAQYGYEGGEFGDCGGAQGDAVTDPDGNRTIGGRQCNKKTLSRFPSPTAPIGSLLVRVGDGPWMLAGSETTLQADRDGAVWLGYNDDYPADDRGSFSATLDVG